METITPVQNCPWCGYQTDRSTSTASDRAPGPGDLSLCIRCAQPSIFGKDMILTKLSAEDKARLKRSGDWAQIRRVQMAITIQHREMQQRLRTRTPAPSSFVIPSDF